MRKNQKLHTISSSAWLPSLIRDWRGWAEGSAWLPPSDDHKSQFVIHSSLHSNYFLGHNHKIPPAFPVISSRRTPKAQTHFPNWGCCYHSAPELLCHLLSPFLQLQTDPWVTAPKWVTQPWDLLQRGFSALTHGSITTGDLHSPAKESVCPCSFAHCSPWGHCHHCGCGHPVKLSCPFTRTSKSCQTTAAIFPFFDF